MTASPQAPLAVGQHWDAQGYALCSGFDMAGVGVIRDCELRATLEQTYRSVAGAMRRTYRCADHSVAVAGPPHVRTIESAVGFHETDAEARRAFERFEGPDPSVLFLPGPTLADGAAAHQGPVEADGDYERDFFDGYEREADRAVRS